jgi:PHS family inorganic phosphate transporter-like MFS transporter
MLAAVFAMQSFSRLLAFAISLGVVKDSNLASLALGSDTSKLVVDRAWRLTIGLGVIPAAIAIILRLTIPETPRYYADIMKDLRKAVKTAFKVYKRYKKHHTEHNSVNSGPSRQGIDETNDRWFEGVWDYLFGSRQVWRRLANISALWGIMDVAWYGMGLDSPSALSTLAFDPSTGVSSINSKRSGAAGCDDQLWNTDSWNTGNTIDHVLKDNSVRSLLIVSIASFLGSMAAIVTINRFRRKSILVATFLLLSVLFAVCGGTLLSATRGHRSHVVSTVFYALLQFMFNLGPNTVIFILAAELFPTVYRGTFFGIAAAIGKIGAIIIRAVIGRTGNSAIPLAHRLLAFIPLMLLAAYLSALLPNVQYLPRTLDAEGAVVQTASTEAEKTPPVTDVPAIQNGKQPTSQREQVQRASVDSISSHGSSSSEQERNSSTQTAHSQNNFLKTFFGRLQNMALEDIAPNPAWDRGKDGEMKSKGPSLPETSAAQASGALPAASLGGNEVVGLNPVVTGGAFQPIILSCGYVDQDH